MFILYCVFSLKCCDFFLNSGSAAALVFYLPVVCTHTDTEGKQSKAKVRNIFKNLEKNTIFNEHPVCICRSPFTKVNLPYVCHLW